MVTEITEWVRCFGLYASIISRSPERVPDPLGYQTLIINAYTEYQGKYWAGYDRQFRLRAAVTPVASWSTVDTTLWNRAFGGLCSIPRCLHRFSVSHKSSSVNFPQTLTHHLLQGPPLQDVTIDPQFVFLEQGAQSRVFTS